MRFNCNQFPKIAGVILVAFPLAFLMFAGSVFYRFLTPADAEFARFSNPSHTLEAVIIDRRMNTTAPDSVLVYILKAKTPVTGHPVVNWADADGLTVTWSGDDALLVHADRARTNDKDYGQHEDVRVGGSTVRVRFEIDALEPR